MADALKATPLFDACIDLFPRLGATNLQLAFQEEITPVAWIAATQVAAGDLVGHAVAAAFAPEGALYALLEQLVDGGQCTHCHRPTALDNDPTGSLAVTATHLGIGDTYCMLVLDPGRRRFIRSCA